MMILTSSEILKKEIMGLPKQMAAVMNTAAETHSEIPLLRNNINENLFSQIDSLSF